MKTSIIYLGLVALSFTNTIAANELKEQNLDKQQDLTTLVLENVTTENVITSSNKEVTTNSREISNNDTLFFDPNSVFVASNKKTQEEIIAENKLVTDYKEEGYQPISLERSMEDNIVENNQIIESDVLNEVYPLDFEKINSLIQCVKVNNNATIIIDLKL